MLITQPSNSTPLLPEKGKLTHTHTNPNAMTHSSFTWNTINLKPSQRPTAGEGLTQHSSIPGMPVDNKQEQTTDTQLLKWMSRALC